MSKIRDLMDSFFSEATDKPEKTLNVKTYPIVEGDFYTTAVAYMPKAVKLDKLLPDMVKYDLRPKIIDLLSSFNFPAWTVGKYLETEGGKDNYSVDNCTVYGGIGHLEDINSSNYYHFTVRFPRVNANNPNYNPLKWFVGVLKYKKARLSETGGFVYLTYFYDEWVQILANPSGFKKAIKDTRNMDLGIDGNPLPVLSSNGKKATYLVQSPQPSQPVKATVAPDAVVSVVQIPKVSKAPESTSKLNQYKNEYWFKYIKDIIDSYDLSYPLIATTKWERDERYYTQDYSDTFEDAIHTYVQFYGVLKSSKTKMYKEYSEVLHFPTNMLHKDYCYSTVSNMDLRDSILSYDKNIIVKESGNSSTNVFDLSSHSIVTVNP